jgi:hypothetical protein
LPAAALDDIQNAPTQTRLPRRPKWRKGDDHPMTMFLLRCDDIEYKVDDYDLNEVVFEDIYVIFCSIVQRCYYYIQRL